jgi:alpha-glucosidase
VTVDSAGSSASRSDRLWWRDAVIYQVYIRSFADGDGDGVGDLSGIRARLDHLSQLGVDALWITPFYPSPMADGGYDVADYRDIEPLFGTLDDADALLRDAHERGLRVIIDLVPNHTSDRHEWFQQALRAPSGSRERDRYIFRTGRGADESMPPNDWLSTFGGPAWHRVEDGEWYLHLFAPEQPDLNWMNDEVRAEFHDILRFWLDRGVDGFRIDVAHGLTKDPDLPDLGEHREEILEPTQRTDHPHWDRDEVHDVYRGWRAVTEEYGADKVMVAEAWVASPERLARYLRPDELHTAFNFGFLKAPWEPKALRESVDYCLDSNSRVGAPATWVIGNHDVVRPVTRYGGGERGVRRMRAAALLMLALPGGAYVYQGEELGLEEVEDLPEDVLQDPVWERSGRTLRGRDGCRVPMPWSGDAPPFGFGDDGAWLPQPARWAKLSVEAQTGDPRSTLELYRSALRIRRASPALGDGTMNWLDVPATDSVLAFARAPGFVCAVNVGGAAAPLPEFGEPVLASADVVDPRLLPSDTAVWYRAD